MGVCTLEQGKHADHRWMACNSHRWWMGPSVHLDLELAGQRTPPTPPLHQHESRPCDSPDRGDVFTFWSAMMFAVRQAARAKNTDQSWRYACSETAATSLTRSEIHVRQGRSGIAQFKLRYTVPFLFCKRGYTASGIQIPLKRKKAEKVRYITYT